MPGRLAPNERRPPPGSPAGRSADHRRPPPAARTGSRVLRSWTRPDRTDRWRRRGSRRSATRRTLPRHSVVRRRRPQIDRARLTPQPVPRPAPSTRLPWQLPENGLNAFLLFPARLGGDDLPGPWPARVHAIARAAACCQAVGVRHAGKRAIARQILAQIQCQFVEVLVLVRQGHVNVSDDLTSASDGISRAVKGRVAREEEIPQHAVELLSVVDLKVVLAGWIVVDVRTKCRLLTVQAEDRLRGLAAAAPSA